MSDTRRGHDQEQIAEDLRQAVHDGTLNTKSGIQSVRALYSGNAVTIESFGELTFDDLSDGPKLLDRTDPTHPVFLKSGLYAITINWGSDSPPDPEGILNAGLYIDQAVTTTTLTTAQNSIIVAPAQAGPALTAIAIVEAGDYFFVNVLNFGNDAAREITIFEATVTKIL